MPERKPERKLNLLQAASLTAVLMIILVVFFWSMSDARADGHEDVVCRDIATTCAVTDTRPVFADKNGTVCDPNKDKKVGCMLRGFSLRYAHKGNTHAVWSAKRVSTVTHVEEVCFHKDRF